MLMQILAEEGDRYRDHDGGPFFFLLFLALVGVGIYFLVRAIRRRRGLDGGDRMNALRTLEERFARGDIDRAEFEHRKAVLKGNDVVPPAPPAGTMTATAAPPASEPRPAPPSPPGFTDADLDDGEETPDGDRADGDEGEPGR